MRVLLTGANGFVGTPLCLALKNQRHHVICAVRSSKIGGDNVERIILESINSETDWSGVLTGLEVVIHLAARVHIMKDDALDPIAEFRKVNVEGTLNLAIQAASAGIKRFIFISSIGVNGSQSILPFTERSNVNPHNAYALSKFEAEEGLKKIGLKTNMEIVIIRPHLVYGGKAPGNFANLLKIVKKRIPLPLGAIYNKRSFIYVENLVSFILCCIDHPEAANQTFLVSDGQDISTTELLKECARAMALKPRLIPVPRKCLEIVAALLGKTEITQRLCSNLQVDITKARTLLGWTPPFSMSEGLKRTATNLYKTERP